MGSLQVQEGVGVISLNIKILELQGYLDDFTGKNENILNESGSQKSEMKVSIPITQVMILFISDTIGITPHKATSYSRRGTRHQIYFKVLPTPSMAMAAKALLSVLSGWLTDVHFPNPTSQLKSHF